MFIFALTTGPADGLAMLGAGTSGVLITKLGSPVYGTALDRLKPSTCILNKWLAKIWANSSIFLWKYLNFREYHIEIPNDLLDEDWVT